MKAAIAEWVELAGILVRVVVAFSVIGLAFSVPVGIIVLVVRLAWSL